MAYYTLTLASIPRLQPPLVSSILAPEGTRLWNVRFESKNAVLNLLMHRCYRSPIYKMEPHTKLTATMISQWENRRMPRERHMCMWDKQIE
jgi:hypothetical protein